VAYKYTEEGLEIVWQLAKHFKHQGYRHPMTKAKNFLMKYYGDVAFE